MRNRYDNDLGQLIEEDNELQPHPNELQPPVDAASPIQRQADRVQATSRSGRLPAAGTTQELLAQALAEVKDCVEALAFAEEALHVQNHALAALKLALREERLRYKALQQSIDVALTTNDIKDKQG